jgi:transcriptional regulator with XRE-family HTH domain
MEAQMEAIYRSKEEVGEFVESLREKNDLTQEDVAEGLGMSQSAVSRIEQAQRGLALEELEAYSNYFSVSVEEILLKQAEGVILMRTESRDSKAEQAAVELLREVIRDYFGSEALVW